ncbi:MAG: hypothetical protein KAY32_03335 [Candidatus Eisenbacteria sp.]|nr:hypothetical protein [Candidatus Eisenbacteria bacterium]
MNTWKLALSILSCLLSFTSAGVAEAPQAIEVTEVDFLSQGPIDARQLSTFGVRLAQSRMEALQGVSHYEASLGLSIVQKPSYTDGTPTIEIVDGSLTLARAFLTDGFVTRIEWIKSMSFHLIGSSVRLLTEEIGAPDSDLRISLLGKEEKVETHDRVIHGIRQKLTLYLYDGGRFRIVNHRFESKGTSPSEVEYVQLFLPPDERPNPVQRILTGIADRQQRKGDTAEALGGLTYGMSTKEVEATGATLSLLDQDRNLFSYEGHSLPKDISDIDFYILIFDEDSSLVKMTAILRQISDDPLGIAGKDRFNELAAILAEKYRLVDEKRATGLKVWTEADEFYECLDYSGCGLWFKQYEDPDKEIALQLKGTGHGTGYITITSEWTVPFREALAKKNAAEKAADSEGL